MRPEPVRDIRSQASAAIRARQDFLAADLEASLRQISAGLAPQEWLSCARLLLRVFIATMDGASLDSAAMRDLGRYSPPLTTRQLLEAVHQTELLILQEVALDGRSGIGGALVGQAVRHATLEIFAALSEQTAVRGVPVPVRDPLTTLIAAPVFEIALEQEIQRALRHKHALAVLLFDINDLSEIDREHGWGVGERLLERTGILARQYFRTHDWVARRGKAAIAVLLPETTLDQAALLAARFHEMVQHRLVLQDHKTDNARIVTLSAAAVGTDLVQSDIDAREVLSEADAAVVRARFNDRKRIERVALLPTSLTIFGASTMLGITPHQVTALIRNGTLPASRRGRHFHIDRDRIDTVRRDIR